MQIKKLNEAFTSMYKAEGDLTENIFEALEAINADEADTKVADTDSESQAQKDDKLTEEQHHKETEEEKKDSDLIRSAFSKTAKRSNAKLTNDEKATLDKYSLTDDNGKAKRSYKTPRGYMSLWDRQLGKSKYNIANKIKSDQSGERSYAQQVHDNAGLDFSKNFQNAERDLENERNSYRLNRVKDRAEARRYARENRDRAEKAFNDEIRGAVERRNSRVASADADEAQATKEIRGILDRKRERLNKKRAERGELTEDRHHKITDDERRDNELIRSAMGKRKAEQSKEERDALDRNGLTIDRRTGSLSYNDGVGKRNVSGTDKYDDKVNLVDKIRTAKSGERNYARDIAGPRNSDSYTRKYRRYALGNFQASERGAQNRKSADRSNLEYALYRKKINTQHLNDVNKEFEDNVKRAEARRDNDIAYYSSKINTDNESVRDVLDNKRAQLNAKRGVTESKKVDENRPSVFEAYKNESVKRAQALHESIARRKKVIESLKEKRATKHLTEAVVPKHNKKPLITENAKMRRKPIKRK